MSFLSLLYRVHVRRAGRICSLARRRRADLISFPVFLFVFLLFSPAWWRVDLAALINTGAGVALCVLGYLSLQVFHHNNDASNQGAYKSPQLYVLLSLGVSLYVAFILYESNPTLDSKLLLSSLAMNLFYVAKLVLSGASAPKTAKED